MQNPTDAPADASAAPSLDGREFVMTSSTASAVDPASPSRFRYHERDGVVWGDYDGDTVTFGRFVGRRAGDSIDVSFVHVLVRDLAVVSGTSHSRVAAGEGEGLRLVEEFSIGGVEHVSVCVEAV